MYHTYICMYVYAGICCEARMAHTAILVIIEGHFQVFQRFSSSKLVLKTVKSRFATLSYYENGSMGMTLVNLYVLFLEPESAIFMFIKTCDVL
jgi:hypothetical protein